MSYGLQATVGSRADHAFDEHDGLFATNDTAAAARTNTGRLRAIVAEADERLARDAAKEAIARLEVALVFDAQDLQSTARRAEAWLRVTPATAREERRRRRALVAFVALADDLSTTDMPFVGLRWQRDKINEVAARARQALGDG